MPNLTYPEQTSAYISVEISDSRSTEPPTQLRYYSKGAYTYNNLPRSVDDIFILWFWNTGSTALEGTMVLSVGATGRVSAVPEADSLSMLLSGMVLLGAIAVRRRNKAVTE
jgi:hypothetical protein